MKGQQVRLGEVLTLQREEVILQPGETYRMAGIYSFGKGVFERESIRGAETSYKSLFRLRAGQFVISRLNGWEGAVDVVGSQVDGCLVSNEYPTFAIDVDRAEPCYLRWIARWPAFWNQLVPRGSMVRRKRVQVPQLLEVEIPLPPKEEQRQIAMNLDRIADLSVRVRAINARALMVSDSTSAALAASDASLIPLADLVEQCKRPVPLQPGISYRLLGCRWYGDGLFVREERMGAEISASKLYEVAAGDLIYNRLFAWKGSFALAAPDVSGCMVSGEFPVFQVRSERVIPQFLLALFRSPAFLAEVDLRSSGGTPTSRNRLKEAEFLQIKVPLPAWEVQERLSSSLQVLTDVTRRRKRLKELASAVVPAAINQVFSGLS